MHEIIGALGNSLCILHISIRSVPEKNEPYRCTGTGMFASSSGSEIEEPLTEKVKRLNDI